VDPHAKVGNCQAPHTKTPELNITVQGFFIA
jgi:hypothetical protein